MPHEGDKDLPLVRPSFPDICRPDVGPLAIDVGISVPASINRFLRPYQRDGVDFFYQKYKAGIGGVLGDDMGSVLHIDESLR